jgi:hypothetical protein
MQDVIKVLEFLKAAQKKGDATIREIESTEALLYGRQAMKSTKVIDMLRNVKDVCDDEDIKFKVETAVKYLEAI